MLNIMRYLVLLLLLCASTARAATIQSTPVSEDSVKSPYPVGFPAAPDQPLGWHALPPGRPFPSLPSDPRDLKIGLRKNSKNEIEADVGGYRSFAGWKGQWGDRPAVFHTGLEGGAYFMMVQEGSKYPLHSSDGLIGLFAEAARGNSLFQFRFTHISAHLSDGLYNVRERFSYTREFITLRAAKQIDFLRIYGGYQFLVHTKPMMPRHSAQLGGYAVFPWHWGNVHPWAGADLRLRSSQEGTTYALSAGAAFVSSLGAPPLRLSGTYLKGHDPRGQFYREKTEKISFGLDMDF